MTYLQKFRKNKYNNSTPLYNGVRYHSIAEADYAAELDLKVRGKLIKSWTGQKKCALDIGDYHICNYYIDFEVIHNDDSIELIEVKGYVTEVWRLKWKIFEAIWTEKYPEIKLTIEYVGKNSYKNYFGKNKGFKGK